MEQSHSNSKQSKITNENTKHTMAKINVKIQQNEQ